MRIVFGSREANQLVAEWKLEDEIAAACVANPPQTRDCGMCGSSFLSHFIWDKHGGDYQSYCSPRCEEIQHQIDAAEVEHSLRYEERLFRWMYWGQ